MAGRSWYRDHVTSRRTATACRPSVDLRRRPVTLDTSPRAPEGGREAHRIAPKETGPFGPKPSLLSAGRGTLTLLLATASPGPSPRRRKTAVKEPCPSIPAGEELSEKLARLEREADLVGDARELLRRSPHAHEALPRARLRMPVLEWTSYVEALRRLAESSDRAREIGFSELLSEAELREDRTGALDARHRPPPRRAGISHGTSRRASPRPRLHQGPRRRRDGTLRVSRGLVPPGSPSATGASAPPPPRPDRGSLRIRRDGGERRLTGPTLTFAAATRRRGTSSSGHVPFVLALLGWSALVVGLARPASVSRRAVVGAEEVDSSSPSMRRARWRPRTSGLAIASS